jgi:hypothetical protein
MYQIVKLTFKNYIPTSLEVGMLFLSYIEEETNVFRLDKLPLDEEAFIQQHGYPIHPYLIDEGNPNIENDVVIYAAESEIGWFDFDEESDEYRDITVKDINNIINKYGCECLIEMDEYHIDDAETHEPYVLYRPIYIEDKVIISLYDNNEEYDDDDDEYNIYNQNDENEED